MPIATVHEHGRPETRKDQIGRAGKILAMQAKPQPERMHPATQGQFGAGVDTADAGHHP